MTNSSAQDKVGLYGPSDSTSLQSGRGKNAARITRKGGMRSMTCLRVPANTIDASMLRTSTAGHFHLHPQRLAGTMYPDCCIVRCDPAMFRKIPNGPFFNVYDLESFSVLRLQIIQHVGHAMADFVLNKFDRRAGHIQVLRPGFEDAIGGALRAIVVNHRVAQQTIKPGDSTFFLTKTRLLLNTSEKRRLQDVFGGHTGTNPFLKKPKELSPASKYSFEGATGQCVRLRLLYWHEMSVARDRGPAFEAQCRHRDTSL